MYDFVATFNALEAVYWAGLGVAAAWAGRRTIPGRKRWFRRLAVVLALIGATDLIELQTGAWWRPWWLAAAKIACGTLIVLCVWRLWTLGTWSKSGRAPERAAGRFST